MSEKRKHSLSLVDKEQRQNKISCKSLELQEKIASDSCICALSNAWKNSFDEFVLEILGESGSVQFFSKPYKHCVLNNFLQNADDVTALREELNELEFSEKNNDLYKFHQSTEDLKTSRSESIRAFRLMLCTTFKEWLKQVTDIPLNETIDAFCAQYIHTDTLLCHDDELEGRRIAYIYYIVNDWIEQDGGSLDLFDVDDNIQPKDIVKSIIPKKNNFVFFEVTPGSYHQVAEILSQDKTRLSISGWFHGPPIHRPSPFVEPSRELVPYGSIDDDLFFDWINPVYMDIGAMGSIQEKFEQDSEIELQDFLIKEKYDALVEEISSSKMCWKKIGPANKRCYEVADSTKLPPTVQTCINLLKSDALFLMLSNMTGLKLHELAGESSESESNDSNDDDNDDNNSGQLPGRSSDQTVQEESSAGESVSNKSSAGEKVCREISAEREVKPCTSRCRTEVRHWTHKCYTLVHDTDTEKSEYALDLVLYIGVEDWDMESGGFTSYIASGEDEELLTVSPRQNSLALVYRDKETLKFVKYINDNVNKSTNKGFYDISAVYYE
ncbi:Prolyl 3-hydroxylase ogfod1 [Mactra antiquata]